jgi:hypothetical protein
MDLEEVMKKAPGQKRGRKTRVINTEKIEATNTVYDDYPVIMSLPIREEDLMEPRMAEHKDSNKDSNKELYKDDASVRSSSSMKSKKETNELVNKLKELQIVLQYYMEKVQTPRPPHLTIKEFQLYNGLQIIKDQTLIMYPRKTDVHCWWCTLQFDNYPIGVPIRMHKQGNVIRYDCVGNCCGFNCALAFSNSWDDGYDAMENRKNMLFNMFVDGYSQCEHMKKTNFWRKTMEQGIPPAPNFRLLPKFTGDQVGNLYSQKDFRVHYFGDVVEVDEYPAFQSRMILPPMCSQKIVVEEDYRDVIVPKVEESKMDIIEKQIENETREKSNRKLKKIMTKVKNHTLDNSMGILVED